MGELIMIQKCSNCGLWVESNKTSVIDRFCKGSSDAADLGGEVGGYIGNVFGKKGKNIGRNLGKLGGSFFGSGPGIGEVVFGDSYQFICPNCGNEWSTDNKEDDQSEEYYHEQQLIDLKKNLYEIWTDKPNHQDLIEFINKISTFIAEEKVQKNLSYLYDWRSIAYWLINDVNSALQDINSSLKLVDNSHSKAMRGFYRFNLLAENPNLLGYIDVIKDLCSIYNENHCADVLSEAYLQSVLEEAIDHYISNFTEIPIESRRFICFTDNLKAMGNQILVLPLGKLPKNLLFSGGIPQKNIIYVVHPLKSTTYLRLDDFDFELFNDKISEFKWILDSLGARKITMRIENEHEERKDNNAKYNAEIKADVKTYGGKVKGGLDTNSQRYEELKRTIEENSEFLPGSDAPSLPNKKNLVWYSHMEDWQRKVESRLSGRVTKFEISVHSHSAYSLSDSLAAQLEAEMKHLMVSFEAKGSISKDYHIERSEDHTWSLTVEFYPLQVYQKNNKTEEDSSLSPINSGEEEYLNLFKECLEDGEITNSQRKLLNQLSKQYGISDSRVAELESAFHPRKKESFWKRLFS